MSNRRLCTEGHIRETINHRDYKSDHLPIDEKGVPAHHSTYKIEFHFAKWRFDGRHFYPLRNTYVSKIEVPKRTLLGARFFKFRLITYALSDRRRRSSAYTLITATVTLTVTQTK